MIKINNEEERNLNDDMNDFSEDKSRDTRRNRVERDDSTIKFDPQQLTDIQLRLVDIQQNKENRK